MLLDLTSLKKAINSFENALQVYHQPEFQNYSLKLQNTIEAGVIQNFEFTYELSWKFIKRWLSLNLGKDHINGLTKKELFRIAAENKLIENSENWFTYHEARNETSHTYNELVAADILEVAEKFIIDAKILLTSIENRND